MEEIDYWAKRAKFLIAATGDQHVGSVYSIGNPTTYCGTKIEPNEGMKRLYKYWRDWVDTCRRLKITEHWNLGDVIAGANPIERGRWTFTDPELQEQAALDLFTMFPKNIIMKFWSGTPYHESQESKINSHIVARLSALGYKALYKGEWSYEQLDGRKAYVTHHSRLASIYPKTPLFTDAKQWKADFADGKTVRVALDVRGHGHKFFYSDEDSVKMVRTPCWQALVPYAGALKMFPHWISDFGGVFIRIDGEDRIDVKPWLYPSFQIDPNGAVIEPDNYDPNRYVKMSIDE